MPRTESPALKDGPSNDMTESEQSDDMKPKYDAFVSYKSEDANEVRTIVDSLLANGLNVWFAEYFVLLPKYDDFQALIDSAIDSSHHGILFTNEAWARSLYCQLEVLRLARRIPIGRTLRNGTMGIATESEPKSQAVSERRFL